MKCINKKNLAKSQTLLGKEIKILKVKADLLVFFSLRYICPLLLLSYGFLFFFTFSRN